MSGNRVLGLTLPQGTFLCNGLTFHIGEGRAGKSFSKVVGSRGDRACAQRSEPTCWGDACPHTGSCLSPGTQRTPRTHGVPWTKGPPGEYRIFPVGPAHGVPETLVLPQGSGLQAVAQGRGATPGALAGGAVWGAGTPLSSDHHDCPVGPESGWWHRPLKATETHSLPVWRPEPELRGRGPVSPLEASPSPRPPGLVDPQPLCLRLCLAFSSLLLCLTFSVSTLDEGPA